MPSMSGGAGRPPEPSGQSVRAPGMPAMSSWSLMRAPMVPVAMDAPAAPRGSAGRDPEPVQGELRDLAEGRRGHLAAGVRTAHVRVVDHHGDQEAWARRRHEADE